MPVITACSPRLGASPLLAFLLLAATPSWLAATIYYVAPGGSDQGPGTLEQPFATVRHALAVASTPGDEVRLRAGVYLATQNLAMGFPGTAEAPIVLGAYADEVAVLDGSAMPETSAALQIAASWVIVEGLEIRHGQRQGISIFGPGSFLHDIVIRDNHIHDNWLGGIFIGHQHLSDPPRDILVVGNDIHHNSRVNSPPASSGWPIASGSGVSRRVTYIGNRIYKNWGEGLAFFLAEACTATGNEVFDNFSINIYLDNATDCRVERNFAYSTGDQTFYRDGRRATGIQIANETYAFSNPSARNLVINNILVDNHTAIRYGSYQEGGGLVDTLIGHNTAYGAVGAVLDIDGDPGHSGSRITDNIFVQTSTEWITWIDAPADGVTYDHNLWFGGALNEVAAGVGDVYQAPVFEGGDALEPLSYRLTRSSPGVGAATPLLQVEDDYLGETRTPPLELGALEIESLFSDGFESGGFERWSDAVF